MVYLPQHPTSVVGQQSIDVVAAMHDKAPTVQIKFLISPYISVPQVLQFGRIDNGCFILDFQAPFSPIQAFATALANLA